jgi:hypothetical protein
MTSFVPYSRRQPPKPIEPGTVLARLYVEPGPPREFRIQFLQNLDAVIGVRRPVNWTRVDKYGDLVTPARIWETILGAVAHEYGFSPNVDRYNRPREVFEEWFLREDQPMSYLLSAIEFAFQIVSRARPAIAGYQDEYQSTMTLAQAVGDLNERFKQQYVDYYLDPGSLTVRAIDSEFLHAEVVTPALTLIRQSGFDGVEKEFNKSLEHHRHNRQEEAITDALKAFESTLKQICDERGWVYDLHKDTASKLIKIVLDNGLLPSWMDQQLTHLRMLLESGTPTVRNKSAGHGAGSTPRQVPSYLAAYAVHTAAANIVLLIEAHKALPI